MLILCKASLSGKGWRGSKGDRVEVPEHDGRQLVQQGFAEDVTPKVEPPPEPEKKSRLTHRWKA